MFARFSRPRARILFTRFHDVVPLAPAGLIDLGQVAVSAARTASIRSRVSTAT